jgi:septum formation protein
MTAPGLVLASASPRRADILRQLGLDFRVDPAEVDERYLSGETPEAHVERLAREKAEAVAVDHPGALVVAGDTVVLDDGRVLTKPGDEEEAVRVLLSLSARTHRVLSGVALAGPHGVVSRTSTTEVTFRRLDEATVRAYVATGEPMDKAGAYGIQEAGAALVAGIRGDYYTVVGFPVAAFLDLLGEAGWRYDFSGIRRESDPSTSPP